MPTATKKLCYQEIKEAIALWLKDKNGYTAADAKGVRVIVDRGGGTPMDSGFIMAKAEIDGMTVELSYYEIKLAIEYWLRTIKILLVTHINSISITEDNGGGTPLDSGTGISASAPIK